MADPVGPGGGSGDGPGVDGLLAELARWAAERAVTEAAAGRARARSLAEQAAASANWAGVLLDLAERGAAVAATLLDGTRLNGRLVGTARDFCHIAGPAGRPLLVRHSALAVVAETGEAGRSALPLGGGPAGDRAATLQIGFEDALEALSGERQPVALVLAGGTRAEGDLTALAEDLVTLRSAPPQRRTVHVSLAAVLACELR